MDHFIYKHGRLYAEDIPIETIAKEVETPFYCYSTATLKRHYTICEQAFQNLPVTICYALKANPNTAVIKTLANMGAGADTTSKGEIKRALHAQIPPEKIIFSGVGKSAEEILFALQKNILQFNVESEDELYTIEKIASSIGKTAQIAFRVNPNVDAKTLQGITTGKSENKFGIEWKKIPELYTYATQMSAVNPTGLAVHIGSQILDITPFFNAYSCLEKLTNIIRSNGHTVSRLDLGGGLGIPYKQAPSPLPAAWANAVDATVGKLNCELIIEPGRLLVGNAGLLITKILFIKKTETKKFAIIDAAMNDLMRPALYKTVHNTLPVIESSPETYKDNFDIVGPICETTDTFSAQTPLPTTLKKGDLLAIRTAGAYSAAMASIYNSRPLIPEVLVYQNQFSIIRKRIHTEDFIAMETFPQWL